MHIIARTLTSSQTFLLNHSTNSTNRNTRFLLAKALQKCFHHFPPPARPLQPLLHHVLRHFSRPRYVYGRSGLTCQCSGSDRWTALVPSCTDVEPTTSWEPLSNSLRQFSRSCSGRPLLAFATSHTGFACLLLSLDHLRSHLGTHLGRHLPLAHHAPQRSQ
jgi:hypothetical protein